MFDATNSDDADMWASLFAKDAICYVKGQLFMDPAGAAPFFGVTDPDVWFYPYPPFRQALLDRNDVVRFECMLYRTGGTSTRGNLQLNFDDNAKITFMLSQDIDAG